MKTSSKAILIVSYVIVGLVLLPYLAGNLYFIANKTTPEGITYFTWFNYWEMYSDSYPAQRKKLLFSGVFSIFLIYVLPPMVVASALNKKRSLYGDARFATSSEIAKSDLNSSKGIIVGKHNNKYLIFGGQQFVLLAAPTRSGKGVSLVIPNLLNFSESVVVSDIKLENFRFTSLYRAMHGQKVYLFSPFDTYTHCWNPLDAVSRDPMFTIGDIIAISNALYQKDVKEESFWTDGATNIFVGLTLYLLETPELPITLGELLRQSSGKGMPVKEYIKDIISTRSVGENKLSNQCTDSLNRFVNNSDNTLTSILSTFNAPLIIFANPIVDAATSRSDFDIRDVRKQLMSIYIGIPPNKLDDSALLVNLFFSQLINLNTDKLPEDNPELKYTCAMFLDEFTAFRKIKIISASAGFIAGYNLRLVPIIQSISQLETVYGKTETRTLVTNHALQIMFPPRENNDAKEYSEMLGYFTDVSESKGKSTPKGYGSHGSVSENQSAARRALMLPQELRELGKRKEIIMMENFKPILCEKAFYYDDPVFVNRLKLASPSLRLLGKKLPSHDQLKHAAWVLKELSAHVPLLNVKAHMAKLEERTRVLKEGEAIDVSSLAINLSLVPTFNDPNNPTKEEALAIVDSIFSQLSCEDEDQQEPSDSIASICTDVDHMLETDISFDIPFDIPETPLENSIENVSNSPSFLPSLIAEPVSFDDLMESLSTKQADSALEATVEPNIEHGFSDFFNEIEQYIEDEPNIDLSVLER